MGFLLHIIGVAATSLFSILGYNMIFGKAKILHFGPIAVSLVAGYGVFLTLPHTGNYAASFLIGLCLATLVSVFLAWLSLRLEPDGMGVLSIAVHLGILAIILNSFEWTRGALGLPGIPRISFLRQQEYFVAAAAALALLWVLFLWWVDRGSYGRKLAALSEQEWYASALGVDRRRMHLIVFVIGGVGAALTTTLYHQYIGIVHPSDFAFSYFIFMITVIVAGGPGSVLGVTVSTILLSFLRESIRLLPLPLSMLGPLRLILFGVILFAAVWYRRDTLFPQQRTV